ncbi:hypothetical protein GUJ93_ZPchr0006g43546 [Zizania palustris]|uniref:PGG domain-containing protein n=1 Tax=Zizania palustris TaxID=103762 RepID=A0A8J5VLD1_ZIZPA|nr:hypothetical protein GUJ93_ZPchr0006g43546 [Zizania palustris]
MSGQLEAYSSEGRAAPVVDVAPGDAAPVAATEVSSTGKRGIPVLIAPYPPRDGRQGAPARERRSRDSSSSRRTTTTRWTAGKKWLKEMRGWLMVLTTVAASVTYQAGINPPGGFWQDDKDGHTAGNPVMHDKFKARVLGQICGFFHIKSPCMLKWFPVPREVVDRAIRQRGTPGGWHRRPRRPATSNDPAACAARPRDHR